MSQIIECPNSPTGEHEWVKIDEESWKKRVSWEVLPATRCLHCPVVDYQGRTLVRIERWRNGL